VSRRAGSRMSLVQAACILSSARGAGALSRNSEAPRQAIKLAQDFLQGALSDRAQTLPHLIAAAECDATHVVHAMTEAANLPVEHADLLTQDQARTLRAALAALTIEHATIPREVCAFISRLPGKSLAALMVIASLGGRSVGSNRSMRAVMAVEMARTADPAERRECALPMQMTPILLPAWLESIERYPAKAREARLRRYRGAFPTYQDYLLCHCMLTSGARRESDAYVELYSAMLTACRSIIPEVRSAIVRYRKIGPIWGDQPADALCQRILRIFPEEPALGDWYLRHAGPGVVAELSARATVRQLKQRPPQQRDAQDTTSQTDMI
jgi:hypothetical protein